MQRVDMLTRINPSKFFPIFERLHHDAIHSHIRRGVSHSYVKTSTQHVIKTHHQKDFQYPLVTASDDAIDLAAAAFADLVMDINQPFYIEAQRVTCAAGLGYTTEHFVETRGAYGVVCVNRYNTIGRLATIELLPGVLWTGDLDIPHVYLGDDTYDVYGTFDCLLLHTVTPGHFL